MQTDQPQHILSRSQQINGQRCCYFAEKKLKPHYLDLTGGVSHRTGEGGMDGTSTTLFAHRFLELLDKYGILQDSITEIGGGEPSMETMIKNMFTQLQSLNERMDKEKEDRVRQEVEARRRSLDSDQKLDDFRSEILERVSDVQQENIGLLGELRTLNLMDSPCLHSLTAPKETPRWKKKPNRFRFR